MNVKTQVAHLTLYFFPILSGIEINVVCCELNRSQKLHYF